MLQIHSYKVTKSIHQLNKVLPIENRHHVIAIDQYVQHKQVLKLDFVTKTPCWVR